MATANTCSARVLRRALVKVRPVSMETRSADESLFWKAVRVQDVRSTGSCTCRHRQSSW